MLNITNFSGNKTYSYPKSKQETNSSNKQDFIYKGKPFVLLSHEQMKNQFISFNGLFKSKEESDFEKIRNNFTPHANMLWTQTEKLAQEHNHKQITHMHLYAASLKSLDKYIKDLDSGKKKYDPASDYALPGPLEEDVISTLFKNPELRAKISPVIEKEIENTEKYLKQYKGPIGYDKHPMPTKELVSDLKHTHKTIADEVKLDMEFYDSMFLASVLDTPIAKYSKISQSFITKLQKAAMLENEPETKNPHIQYYDKGADHILKNIDLGNDMFMLYDTGNEKTPKYIINSLLHLAKEPNSKYKNLNAQNTDVKVLNDSATFNYLGKVIDNARKDPFKTTVIVAPFERLLVNSVKSSQVDKSGDMGVETDGQSFELVENKPIKGLPDNVRLVLVANKDNYFANMALPIIKPFIADYGVYSIPLLNAENTKNMLTENSQLVKKEAKKEFSPEAITRSVEIANTQEGIFPSKALKLMKSIASYYVDRDEISLADINNYVKETKGLQKNIDNNGSFKVVFDTEKRISDIVGNDMTKSQANSIVRQIKDKSIGTKGVVIYSNYGSSGGGRRHTAEAIAGEAGIPFISVNARDFAIKDIDALAQKGDYSEEKVKKLISLAKTQAEANKDKSAMIFIENFDNFGSNPLTGISSIYEQKAFSQLLSEMDNLRRNGDVNLLVVGSANYPEYIDDEIKKPGKFLDNIVVYAPQCKKDRVDILNYYTNKKKYNIVGDTPQDKANIVNYMAETTDYFSVVELIDVLDKANVVAKEREHSAINKSDVTEAYLRTVSGTSSTAPMYTSTKEMFTKHEIGHALDAVVMYNISEKLGKPWLLPQKLNFVTLDPRGDYGGAMFPKRSENDLRNFDTLFADLVCDFGGHSSEKEFYDQDGSWGITADMEMATSTAKSAVQIMCMGPKTGKISVSDEMLHDMSPRIKNNIDKDVELFLKNSNLVSDKIIHAYSGFIDELSQKYAPKVGTGDCIIMSDEFESELSKWKENQDPQKQQELESLETEIISIMDKTKKGELAAR